MSEIESPYSENQVTVFCATAEAYGKGKMFVRHSCISQHARVRGIVIEEGSPGVIYLFQCEDARTIFAAI
jgi:hypothetical protein